MPARSKQHQQRIDAKNKYLEKLREEKEAKELEITQKEEWHTKQKLIPKAMVMMETKIIQDIVNQFDCPKCGQKGKSTLTLQPNKMTYCC